MPKLGEQYRWLLNLPFFLYRTTSEAESGSSFGGTGFLVTINVRGTEIPFAVTNAHIALGEHRSGAIRVNCRDGRTRIISTRENQWFTIQGQHDIAVMIADWITKDIEIEALALTPNTAGSFYIDDEFVRDHEIDAGDDVFMVGRFVSVDGRQGNQPALRFGNISILQANVQHPLGFQGRSMILDMRSRSGFSGSPVFVYRTTGSIFSAPNTIASGGHLLKLLGIHYGQFPEKVVGGANNTEIPSGMTLIHPTSSILEVINGRLRAA